MKISQFLGEDHRRCDELFIEAERLLSEEVGMEAREALDGFLQATERHFAMEEELLFPAFEAATGNASGPTAVMRHEHQQMRRLFQELSEACARHEKETFLGASETLLVLMRQHNAKEEQILYPMSDRVVRDVPALVALMLSRG